MYLIFSHLTGFYINEITIIKENAKYYSVSLSYSKLCFINPIIQGLCENKNFIIEREIMKKKAIDHIDLKILSILQSDARITNHELSNKVNLSPSSCLQRVRRLEDEKYINRYMAHINLDKVCRTVTIILTVSLHDHTNENFDTFNSAVEEFPEITECYTVSGNFDYFLRVVCPDMKRYLALNDALIERMEGTANISGHVVLANTKPSSGFSIEKLVE